MASSSSSGPRRGPFVAPGCDEGFSPRCAAAVLDILMTSVPAFSKVLAVSEAIEVMGADIERAAFNDLKALFAAMQNGGMDSINMEPFLEKLGVWSQVDYLSMEHMDVIEIWDSIIKLVMIVVPDLRSVFVGNPGAEIPGWMNHMNRNFVVSYTPETCSLEDLIAASYAESKELCHAAGLELSKTSTFDAMDTVVMLSRGKHGSNAHILRRSPDVLTVSVESPFDDGSTQGLSSTSSVESGRHQHYALTDDGNFIDGDEGSSSDSDNDNGVEGNGAKGSTNRDADLTKAASNVSSSSGQSQSPPSSAAGKEGSNGATSTPPALHCSQIKVEFPMVLDLTSYSTPSSASGFGSVPPRSGQQVVVSKNGAVYDLVAVVLGDDVAADGLLLSTSSYYFRSPPTSPGDDTESTTSTTSLAGGLSASSMTGKTADIASSSSATTSTAASITTATPVGVIDDCWFHGVDGLSVLKSNAAKMFDSAKCITAPSFPRLLVYVRRGSCKGAGSIMPLPQPQPLPTKAQLNKTLGDISFALATTLEHFEEARKFYEEASALDESFTVGLVGHIAALEKFERTQKTKALEEQGDLALANRRFREASEHYKSAIRTCIVGSSIHARVKEKEEGVSKAMALDAAAQSCDRAETALINHNNAMAKDALLQAQKLASDLSIISIVIAGVEKTIHINTSTSKIAEAYSAMRNNKFRLANSLFREAVAMVPDQAVSLQPVLDSLGPQMCLEDALAKQKAGQQTLEGKMFPQALLLFTEAIALLPLSSSSSSLSSSTYAAAGGEAVAGTEISASASFSDCKIGPYSLEHATFLADRGNVHYQCNDFQLAINDYTEALSIRPDLAIAYFRLGAAQFGLDLYDDAAVSYEKSLKFDASLSEQVKAKVRQLNTAKEVQQRKEREAERARAKEDEEAKANEKRVREEHLRKERADKAAQDAAEKAERARVKEEELKMKKAKELESAAAKEKEKAEEADRKRIEKIERDAQKALERERAKVEKEAEREKARIDREAALLASQVLKREEEERKRVAAAERERSEAQRKEQERLKEEEKERLRLERERVIAEREKARVEKEAARLKDIGDGGGTPKKDGPISASNKEVSLGSGGAGPLTSKQAATKLGVTGSGPLASTAPSSMSKASGLSASSTIAPSAPTPSASGGASPAAKWSSIAAPKPPPAPPIATISAGGLDKNNKKGGLGAGVGPSGVGGGGGSLSSGSGSGPTEEFPPLASSGSSGDMLSSLASGGSGARVRSSSGSVAGKANSNSNANNINIISGSGINTNSTNTAGSLDSVSLSRTSSATGSGSLNGGQLLTSSHLIDSALGLGAVLGGGLGGSASVADDLGVGRPEFTASAAPFISRGGGVGLGSLSLSGGLGSGNLLVGTGLGLGLGSGSDDLLGGGAGGLGSSLFSGLGSSLASLGGGDSSGVSHMGLGSSGLSSSSYSSLLGGHSAGHGGGHSGGGHGQHSLSAHSGHAGSGLVGGAYGVDALRDFNDTSNLLGSLSMGMGIDDDNMDDPLFRALGGLGLGGGGRGHGHGHGHAGDGGGVVGVENAGGDGHGGLGGGLMLNNPPLGSAYGTGRGSVNSQGLGGPIGQGLSGGGDGDNGGDGDAGGGGGDGGDGGGQFGLGVGGGYVGAMGLNNGGMNMGGHPMGLGMGPGINHGHGPGPGPMGMGPMGPGSLGGMGMGIPQMGPMGMSPNMNSGMNMGGPMNPNMGMVGMGGPMGGMPPPMGPMGPMGPGLAGHVPGPTPFPNPMGMGPGQMNLGGPGVGPNMLLPPPPIPTGPGPMHAPVPRPINVGGPGGYGPPLRMRDERMDRPPLAPAPPLNAPISAPVSTTPTPPPTPVVPKFEVTLPPLNTGPPQFDVLQDGIFPSLQWLRQCGIALCRWAGENNDWTRLAFLLPDSLVSTVIGPEGSSLRDLQNRSGCKMKIERQIFQGPMGPRKETCFLCMIPVPNASFSMDSNIILQNGLETFQNFMRSLVGRPLVSNNIVTSANSGPGQGTPTLSRDFLGLDALTRPVGGSSPAGVIPPVPTIIPLGGGGGDSGGVDFREGGGHGLDRDVTTGRSGGNGGGKRGKGR